MKRLSKDFSLTAKINPMPIYCNTTLILPCNLFISLRRSLSFHSRSQSTMHHRQTSLFSFLRKPTPGNEGSGVPYLSPEIGHSLQPKKASHPTPLESKNDSKETSDEIGGRGTDASSQKMRRQVLSAGIPVAVNDGNRRANHFSSIMDKFVKEDKSRCSSNGYMYEIFADLSFWFISIMTCFGEFLPGLTGFRAQANMI